MPSVRSAAALNPPWAASSLMRLAPGVALCGAVSLAAMALQAAEHRWVGHIWLESLVLAIVVGALVRAVWTPSAAWRPGLVFSARTLLETAVVLLGASASVATVLAAGPALLIGVAAVVVMALGLSYGLGRALGLSRRMAALVACGNSICGNSAIAAVAPVIGAEGEEVAASIAFTAVLGVVVVLVLPVVGAGLHMSGLQYGALAGLTVYAVPQVLAATAPLGAVAVQFGTLVKLVRVLMLGPLCFGLSMVSARLREAPADPAPALAAGERASGPRPSLGRFVPWFIVGFVLMMGLRSLGFIPRPVLAPLAATASVLTIVSMAALGLGTDVRLVARSGAKVSAAVTLSLLSLALISLLLIHLLKLR